MDKTIRQLKNQVLAIFITGAATALTINVMFIFSIGDTIGELKENNKIIHQQIQELEKYVYQNLK